ncbi:Smr/MutS family protein [Novosphingobium aquimarinum]|uniref:Smr/MutS family protein n=1 Tax=Novosphingobium aquimarinum TaxID=2682494 RepID=UPI0012EB7974|nr:Smr/MutS family protein [Novosphingobium aquimarinum]
MRRPGRRLSAEEAEAWAQVARTVAPIEAARLKPGVADKPAPKPAPSGQPQPSKSKQPVRPKAPPPKPPPAPAPSQRANSLDSTWDRKLTRGTVMPDYTLDLHGASLDVAYSRLLHGLAQARALDARVVLVVTGKPRPVDAADRGTRRGAIRAKIVDWIAASSMASEVAAIRNAHRRHGGSGALYVILKRRRG